MIELKIDQLQALDDCEQPPVAVDPRTGQKYRLIRQELFEKMQAVLRPIDKAWDDSELDVYESYRKKS